MLDAVLHYPGRLSSFALNKLLFSPRSGFVQWFLACDYLQPTLDEFENHMAQTFYLKTPFFFFLLSTKPLGFLIGAPCSRFLFLTFRLSYWERPGTLTSFITAPATCHDYTTPLCSPQVACSLEAGLHVLFTAHALPPSSVGYLGGAWVR